MTEIETIARAQMYTEKLANGIDPLTDSKVGESDIVNNIRISKCLLYVSGILEQIVNNKGKFRVEMPKRAEFSITPGQLAAFEFSQQPISVTELAKRINLLINTLYVKELKSKAIIGWLVEIGLLSNIVVNNRTRRRPTDAGIKIGISVEDRINMHGTPYQGVFYDINAQHFIVDNIQAII